MVAIIWRRLRELPWVDALGASKFSPPLRQFVIEAEFLLVGQFDQKRRHIEYGLTPPRKSTSVLASRSVIETVLAALTPASGRG